MRRFHRCDCVLGGSRPASSREDADPSIRMQELPKLLPVLRPVRLEALIDDPKRHVFDSCTARDEAQRP